MFQAGAKEVIGRQLQAAVRTGDFEYTLATHTQDTLATHTQDTHPTILTLYTHFTLTLATHLVYTRCTLSIHSLHTQYTLATHLVYIPHYTHTMHSLCTHYPTRGGGGLARSDRAGQRTCVRTSVGARGAVGEIR
jgi:hypothetical protein